MVWGCRGVAAEGGGGGYGGVGVVAVVVEDEARGPVDRVAGRVSELGQKSFPAAVGRSGGGCRILREKRECV
ncbi:hypothetical protein Tco_0225585, partial [Tanacetum coccineum]